MVEQLNYLPVYEFKQLYVMINDVFLQLLPYYNTPSITSVGLFVYSKGQDVIFAANFFGGKERGC